MIQLKDRCGYSGISYFGNKEAFIALSRANAERAFQRNRQYGQVIQPGEIDRLQMRFLSERNAQRLRFLLPGQNRWNIQAFRLF